MPEWSLESRDVTGKYLGTLPFRNLQGEFFLNKPDQIRWTMPLHGLNMTTAQFYPGKTEVWLWRDGVKVFVGPVWDANLSTKDNTMNCSAEGLESYLWQLNIISDVKYSTTYGQMAWNLINTVQGLTGGNYGIVNGGLVSGGAPSGTVKYAGNEMIVIGDAITDLSNMDTGFDWQIDVNRNFVEYYPRLSGNANVRLDYGGNVTGYSLQVMGKYEANYVKIQGPDNTISSASIDTTMRSQYGLRMYVESQTGMKSAAQLNGYAALTLKRRRDVRLVPQVSIRSQDVNPFNGDISFGQIAPLFIDDEWTQFNQNMRLDGFQLTLGKHGEETFVLYLNDLREVT